MKYKSRNYHIYIALDSAPQLQSLAKPVISATPGPGITWQQARNQLVWLQLASAHFTSLRVTSSHFIPPPRIAANLPGNALARIFKKSLQINLINTDKHRKFKSPGVSRCVTSADKASFHLVITALTVCHQRLI